MSYSWKNRDALCPPPIRVGAEGVEPSCREAAGFKPAVSAVPPRAHDGSLTRQVDTVVSLARSVCSNRRPGSLADVRDGIGATAAGRRTAACRPVPQARASHPAHPKPDLGARSGLRRGRYLLSKWLLCTTGHWWWCNRCWCAGCCSPCRSGRHGPEGGCERIDWLGAVLVVSGLVLFLTVANPGNGSSNAAWSVWVLLLTVDGLVALGLIALSRGRSDRMRAVCLSGAAGVIYGAAAALAKTTSHLFASGPTHALAHWEPYVLAVWGIAGMVVGQSAFQAGALDVSLPTMTVADPVVSIMVGALAFGESISSSPPAVVLEVLGLAAMTIGVFLLARHEAVDAAEHTRVMEVRGGDTAGPPERQMLLGRS